MSDYIKKDEITKWYSETHPVSAEALNNLAFLKEVVECMPTADVAPVKHGHWKKSDILPGMLTCTCCGCQRNPKFNIGFGEWNRCPNCGAMMDEEAET